MNIAVGISTSGLVVIAFELNVWSAPIIGAIGWQLAYSLDCLDGQVARATDQATPQGAVFDLLGDLAVQISVVAVAVHITLDGTVGWWTGLFGVFVASGWVISPFYTGVAAVLPKRDEPQKRFPIVARLRHARDYGFVVFVFPIAMLIGAPITFIVLTTIALLNFGALGLGIMSFGLGRRSTL